MNLHRVTGTSDWAQLTPAQFNGWQRVAARSHGILTPANVITLIGLGIVGAGVWCIAAHLYWWAAGALVAGRLLDLADGIVAHATGTKSQLGELWDALADKLGTFGAVVAVMFVQIVPWWVVLALVAPQLVIASVALYKKRTGATLHPTRSGKLSMAALWVAIVGLVIVGAEPGAMMLVGLVGIFAVVSILLGCHALSQYLRGNV